jgi:UDP-glucuronate 4-epimerase
MSSLLITGGAGFIGSSAAEFFLSKGWRVGIIDNFNDFYNPSIKRKNITKISKDVELFEGDICDKNFVDKTFSSQQWDVVLHLAARAGVRPSISDPDLYVHTNVLGTTHVLEATKNNNINKLVFASSSSVYGATNEIPFKETSPLHSTYSPYAATKVAGEQLCSVYANLYDLQIVALRFFTVYGPKQRPDLAIHKFTKAIVEEKPIVQFGDGTSKRDYTYIDDILQGIQGAVDYNKSEYEVFNLGESQTNTLSELIAEIESVVGKKALIEFAPNQPGDMPATWADITKAQQHLNYKPVTKLTDGIKKFVEWYKSVALSS